jgi:sulfur-oxidizing protein SoxZ
MAVRIRLPQEIKEGEVIRIRALVPHVMEVVQRDSDGNVVDKNYNFIHSVVVTYNGKEIMRGQLTQAISANPYIEFPVRAMEPGVVEVTFEDTHGEVYTGSAEIAF